MPTYYENLTQRTGLILGKETIKRLSATNVIIFGVGGVGSWCAEALVRTGFTRITIVDYDVVCPTNVNRQAEATSENIGMIKVFEMEKVLKSINPQANVTSIHKEFSAETLEDFHLNEYDYVIDAIDSIKNKVLLLETCISRNIRIYSSMGAASKTDPGRIKSGLLSETKNCPLAKIVRQNLRKKNITIEIPCVYSDELPIKSSGDNIPTENDVDLFSLNDSEHNSTIRARKKINGSLVHITGIFGFTLAGMVIRDVLNKKKTD